MSGAIYSKEHKYLVERLKTARMAAGLTQQQAASLLRKTQSYLSKIESGQRRVDLVQLSEFAQIYKRRLSYFLR